jgi:hypothetical protein
MLPILNFKEGSRQVSSEKEKKKRGAAKLPGRKRKVQSSEFR